MAKSNVETVTGVTFSEVSFTFDESGKLNGMLSKNENGDFQPSDTDHYMVDPKWELDSDGNLQRRERELWTFNWDEYFSD